MTTPPGPAPGQPYRPEGYGPPPLQNFPQGQHPMGAPPAQRSAPPLHPSGPPPGSQQNAWAGPPDVGDDVPGRPPTQGKGLIGALFDLNFNHLVTTKLIKLFYGLALLMISASALVIVAIGLWLFDLRNGQFLGVLVILCSPFVWLFEALLVRIFMESIVVRFKTAEYLRVIKDKL